MILSIITINKNNAAGLEKTLRSIVLQKFREYEIIIIDGASSDSSLEVISKYLENIAYWVSESDLGIYNAMNKGIKKATGKYCFFLNSGDYLVDNDVLNKVFGKAPTEDILFGNLIVTINDKNADMVYGKETLNFSDIYSNIVKHQASFIKKELFDSYGFYNERRKIIADWEFFLKTLGFGNVSYRYVNVFISYFDNDGLSNRNAELVKEERKQVIEENIPARMQPDFEFLYNYRNYLGLFRSKVAFFFIRVFRKIILK